GNDSERLLLFLLDDLDIDWAENAEIRKSDDGKIICIFKDENSAEIMIDEEKEKATLKIGDGKIIDLKVKKENGKLSLYDDTKKKILEELMIMLKKKAETKELENESYFKDAVQSCVMLSHFYGLKAKFDHPHEAKWKKKEAECMEEAGKLIEGKVRDVELYKELMNLQWRCYVSATKKYDKMSDLQKAMEIRVKLNEVFERITERHPFSSPIIDNVFENYKETTNLIKKCWSDSHGDKCRK
ncbi:MAG: hypothetical protein KAT65_17865, partial [Methanophagales archaeon]|nr:hypothetical protein [Methanophagales archaeon]